MYGLKHAVTTCFAKYAQWAGRAPRAEFWWFFVFQFGVYLLASLASPLVHLVALLVLFLPSLTVAVRRLHDLDRSGWWLLVGWVPVLGFLLLLYWFVQPGTAGPNTHGEASSAPALAPGQT